MRKYLFGISFALALAACGDGGEETPGDAVCGNGTTESGETCDDGNTSGGDGCSSTCVAEVGGGEACGDGADDDGDGLTDCDDPDCSSTIACLGGTEVCDNGADDDGDGATDCDDTDCAADAACQATAEVCDNGTDDDGDGDADCDDADCAGDAACQAGTEICDNGTDDDGDGDADCDDADCAGDAACQTGTEICDNGTDDDGDGDADCDDADCADDAACQTGTEICDNDTDDDGDGDIDCDDSDCTDDAACAAGPDCGNGTLNDGEECDNGDANSDTTPDACRTNCTNPSCGDAVVDTGEACDGEDDCTTECTFTVGCGNGRVDEGEDCDDGDENSDLIPDACRLGCVAPSCGDGVIDSGESCDDAELNGDDAACLTTCQANVVLACADAPDFVDLSVDGTVTAAGTTYAGTFAGATDDTDAPTGCIEGTVRGEDLVFAFTAPTAGNFAVRTSVASNVADTAIYQLSDCVGGVPGICNDDDGGDFGSKIVLRDLAAGELVYFAVEHVAGAARFSLLVEAVGDVADEGESCAGDTTCAEGLDCIDVGAGPVCMADAAPVLTSLTVQTLASGLVLHRFVGTDPNRDVEGLVIDSITFDDDSVETDLTPTFQPTVAWTGDTFAMDWIADWTAFSGGPLAVEVVAHVFDANGNESGTRAATVAPYAPVEVTEACDITRLTNTCAAPDTCTRNSDGSDSCGAPVAPTLTAGRAVRTGADAVNFLFDGEDANGDVVQWNAEFLDDTGATQVELTFDLDGYTFGLTSYGLQSLITGLTADAGVASVRATLIDATGLESGTVTIALPVPLPAFEGEACDLDGIDAACIDGTVCSPTDAGGICAAPAAPEITSVEAYYLDYDTFESFVVEIEGVDPNGDVETMDVYVTDSDDNFYGPLTLTTANMVPDPTGRAVFAFTTIELLTDGTEFKDAYVGLTDSTGLTSEFVSDPLAIEGGVGAACSFDGADGACDAGTTCGASGVCEVPEPPVLVSATGTRLDETTMMFTAEGTDANGDVLRWVGRLFDADDVALTGDFNFTLGADVHGLTEFTVAPEIGGFDLFPTVSYVTFTLEDDAGLLSNTIRVAVPGVVEVGGDCVGDGITDICADGTRCEAGVCVSSPPTVTAASAAQRDDNIRLLDIEVGGADADNDVTTFTFEFFDADGFSVTGPVAFDAELDAPEGTTYAGDEFVYLITLDWSAIAFWGVADATVFATDSQGQTSDTYAFSFRPVVGLGDECDASEATNICAVGFVCAGDPATCEIDEADPCAGVAVDNIEDVGVPSGDGIIVAFDTNGLDNLVAASCTAGGLGARGGETVVSVFADNFGRVTVTTALEATAYDTYVYVREDFCTIDEAMIACNDDTDGLQSEVSFDAYPGSTYYVFLDGYNASGVGEAYFTFTPYALLDESCEVDPCAPGLFCDATLVCVPMSVEGESCAEVPCEDGLTCTTDTFVCAPFAAEGEDCTSVACADDLVCDDTLVCVLPLTACEMEATPIASDAEFFVGDMADAVDLIESPCSFGGEELVFAWTSDVTGTVTVDTADSIDGLGDELDTILYVMDLACAPEATMCNDDVGGGPLTSEVVFDAVEGETYYFAVETFFGGTEGLILGNITR